MRPSVFALMFLTAAVPAHAIGVDCSGYPSRPVSIIVPFPPGGPTDAIARVITQAMSNLTGRTFLVVNRPGAGGTIGAQVAASAEPNGDTIILTTAALAAAPSIYKLSFNPQVDLVPIGQVAAAHIVLVVNPSLPVRSVSELVKLAHSRPGTIQFASPGSGTPIHLVGELFKRAAQIDILHVPYQGSAPAREDVLGNRVPMMFDAVQSVLPLVQAGKLRALAVTGSKRLSQLPDVPTMTEAGYGDVNVDGEYLMFAPKGTPQCVVALLERHLREILAAPAVQVKVSNLGAEVVWMPGGPLKEKLGHEIAMWRDVVENLHLPKR